jgi:hypothetical protein
MSNDLFAKAMTEQFHRKRHRDWDHARAAMAADEYIK